MHFVDSVHANDLVVLLRVFDSALSRLESMSNVCSSAASRLGLRAVMWIPATTGAPALRAATSSPPVTGDRLDYII